MGCIVSNNRRDISRVNQQAPRLQTSLPREPADPQTAAVSLPTAAVPAKSPLSLNDQNVPSASHNFSAKRPSGTPNSPESKNKFSNENHTPPAASPMLNPSPLNSDSKRASSRRKSKFCVEETIDLSKLAGLNQEHLPCFDSHGSLDPEQNPIDHPLVDPRKFDSVTNFAGPDRANGGKIVMKNLYAKIDAPAS